MNTLPFDPTQHLRISSGAAVVRQRPPAGQRVRRPAGHGHRYDDRHTRATTVCTARLQLHAAQRALDCRPLIDPLMKPFLETYPDVKLDVVFDDRFVDVAADAFDAGLRIGELLEKDMIAVRIGAPLRTAVVVSPAYVAERGAPKRPADLLHHACIGYRFASTRAVASWDFVDRGRDAPLAPDPRLSANTMALAVEAAAQGIGLAFTIERLAAKHWATARSSKYCACIVPNTIHSTSIIRAVASRRRSSRRSSRSHAHTAGLSSDSRDRTLAKRAAARLLPTVMRSRIAGRARLPRLIDVAIDEP